MDNLRFLQNLVKFIANKFKNKQLNNFCFSIHTELVIHTDLVECVILVLEAGHEAGIDLQGVVVSSQLE